MFSLLRTCFAAAAEPVIAMRYGARHFRQIDMDDATRRGLARHKTGTEGMLTVSSYLLYASLLPFGQTTRQTLELVGQAGISVGLLYTVPLMHDFLFYGRQEMQRQAKLAALTRNAP